MKAIWQKLGSLLKRGVDGLVDVHTRADLPQYLGPYGAGAWWSR